MASKMNYRDTNDHADDHNTKSEEVGEIIRKGVDDTQALRLLRDKYDPKLAEKLFDVYKERMSIVQKKAQKFKHLIFEKYSTLPLPSLLEKAKKFKKKYELSDDEFHAFINLAINDKSYATINQFNHPNTSMAKLLGQSDDINTGKMNVSTNELDILQDILRLYSDSTILHEQIKIQSLTYQDCAPQAITGTYNREKHNSFSYIHPVIAALYLPRIKYIDEHTLLASLAFIVNCRYNGIPIRTLPDYELYYDLKTDPNEAVCVSSNDSPLADIRNRVRLQLELWKQVRELREGRYYSDEFRSFNLVLDSCKNNLFSDADMANVRDEGTVIRKLFGAFSLRPTIISVATLPSQGIMTGNYNLGPMASAQITTIPIVNLRLPLTFRGANTAPVYLNSALEQYNWFVENRSLAMKSSAIVFSRDILVFYANRRFQAMNYSRLTSPYNFCMLPATHTALETVNEANVTYDPSITVGDDTFLLRSVVFIEKSFMNKDLITGCTAGIVVRPDFSAGRSQSLYLLYDPQGAAYKFEDPPGSGNFVNNGPIVEIPGNTPYVVGGNAPDSFQQRASRRGTIYIYVKDTIQSNCVKY